MSAHSRICASCKSGTVTLQSTFDTDDTKLPRWLRECDYVKNFVESYQSFRQNHPSHSTAQVSVQLSPEFAGRSVLFWATKPSPGMLSIKDAKSAYGNFSNSGVSYVKSDGSVVFKLGCPQVYSVIPFGTQKPQTFPRHVHWMLSDPSKKKWLDPVMTTNILCGTTKEQVVKAIRNQTAFVVNALSSNYHSKLSIPGTCSIGHERVAALSSGRLCSEVKRKMERQIPDTLLKTKQKYSDLPIILYCAHRECNAAKRLAGHLLRAGFTNLYYYKEGLMGWFGADVLREAFSH